MTQPKDQPVDELREQITHLVHGDWISYESLQSGRVGGVNDNTEPETTELVDKLYELCQAECNRARQEGRDETHKLYEREMKHLKDFQEAVVSREALKIEPVRLCAACSQQLMKGGE